MMKYLLFTLLFATKTMGAPHPLTGSSIINQPSNAIAFSQLGFSLENIPANWIYTKNISQPVDSIELGVQDKTLLTFKLENTTKKVPLETYVRQYLRDYNQYGFEVISLHSDSKNVLPTVVVDIKQKNKITQSRQVFFQGQNKIIIATCTDEILTFSKTITTCNQILNSFKWRL